MRVRVTLARVAWHEVGDFVFSAMLRATRRSCTGRRGVGPLRCRAAGPVGLKVARPQDFGN